MSLELKLDFPFLSLGSQFKMFLVANNQVRGQGKNNFEGFLAKFLVCLLQVQCSYDRRGLKCPKLEFSISNPHLSS